MSYSIISACSSDYILAYNQFVPYWKADHVRIYSNSSLLPLKNVEIVPISIDGTWLENVGIKPKIMLDFWENCTTDFMIFVDIDCYINSRLDHLCQTWSDIGVTRRGFDVGDRRVKSSESVSSGVVCVKKNEFGKLFLEKWQKEQESMLISGYRINKFCISYNEMSINNVVSYMFPNMVIMSFSQIYNLKVTDILNNQNITQVKSFLPQAVVLHFYRHSFTNRSFSISSVPIYGTP